MNSLFCQEGILSGRNVTFGVDDKACWSGVLADETYDDNGKSTKGLWLSVKPEISACLNYNEKIEKIRKILSCWKYRRLTLLGRITVLKSLAASQLVYLLFPMPSNYHAINEINTLFYQFLWNGKGEKIKRKIMINDYCEGGLKMIDLVSFNKSLKTTWTKKILGFHEQRKMESFY